MRIIPKKKSEVTLRERGLRLTGPRRVILEVVRSTTAHPSAAQVYARVRRRLPRVSLATVYRNLRSLVEEGWLVPVEVPGEPARYEPAGKRHHHHFRCRRCDRLFELGGCRRPVPRAPKGFVVESHELTLYGRCASCAGP